MGHISLIGRRLDIRADTGKSEIPILENEHLAGHEKEPPARHRHHAVPDEPDRAEREIEPKEFCECVMSEYLCDFCQLTRNGIDGIIVAEGHVPDLSGKNKEDGGKLDTKPPTRKDRNHGQCDAGQEGKYRYRLKDVKKRNHDFFVDSA